MPSDGLVQSISRSLDMIEYICQSPEGLGVTQVASELGLAKTTAHRILRALVQRGYVYQDPTTGVYGPGTKILKLAGELRGALIPHHKVGPFVRDLKQKTGEHAFFATIAFDRQCIVVCNEATATDNDVLVGSRLGKRFPLNGDEARVAYVAQLSEYQREAVLRSLSETLTQRELAEFEAALKKSLKPYYITDETMGNGITSIACVVKDHTDYAVGIVGVLLPTYRVTEKSGRELGELTRNTADRIAIALGRPEPKV